MSNIIHNNIKKKKAFGRYFYFNVGKTTELKKANMYSSPLEVASNIKEKEHYLIKYDVEGKNERPYISYGGMSYNDIENIWQTNNNLFEIINTPIRKAYFDIDKKFISDEDWENTLKALNTLLKREMKVDIFDKQKTAFCEGRGMKDDFMKISAHIIINNDLYFESQSKQKQYMIYLHNIIENEDEFKLLRGGVLDIIPYCKNQAFKLPYQSKVFKNIIQTPKNGYMNSLKDYLISIKEDKTTFYDVSKSKDCKTIQIKTSGGRNRSFDYNLGVILREYKRAFPDNYKVEIKQDKLSDIDFYMKSIPNNKKVSRQVWKTIGFCLSVIYKNNNEGLIKWWEWTKLYDENITIEKLKPIYESHSLKGYGLNTLRKIASIFNNNIENDNSGLDYLFDYKPPYNCNELTIKSKYIDCEEFDILNEMKKHKIMTIKSPMGSGKSYTMKRIFEKKNKDKSLRYKTILYLSNKRAFSCSMEFEFQNYGFENYINIDNKSLLESKNRLICSLESIKYCKDKYDLVIVDESESIADNMSGEMIKKNEPIDNLLKYHSILTKSKRVFFMDAYLSQRTFKMIVDLFGDTLQDKKPFHLHNTFLNPERKYIEMGKPTLINKLIERLNDGKRCVLVSGSNTFNINVKESVLEQTDIKEDEIKFYSSKNPLPLNTNVNEEWSKCKLLLYTPTITSGISYDNKDFLFDNLFIYCVNKGSCHFRDTIQAHKRVRHFKDNKIYIIINEEFQGFDRSTMPRTFYGVKQLNEKYKRKLFDEDIKSLKDIERLNFVYNVNNYNILERNISSLDLGKFAQRYLKMENITMEKFTEDFKDDNLLCDVGWDEWNFNNIEFISQDNADLLSQLISNGSNNIEDNEIQQLIKFHYIKNAVEIKKKPDKYGVEEDFFEIIDDKIDIKRRFFDKQFSEKATRDTAQSVKDFKKLLYEIKFDYSKLNEHPIINKMRLNGVYELYEMKYKRYEYIFDFMKHLKIIDNGKINIDKLFTGDDFIPLIDKYENVDIKTLNCLLNEKAIKRKKGVKITSRQVQAIFNNLLKDEFHMEIKNAKKDKYIKVNGKKKKITSFHISYKLTNKQEDEKILLEREYNAFNIFKDKYEASIELMV